MKQKTIETTLLLIALALMILGLLAGCGTVRDVSGALSTAFKPPQGRVVTHCRTVGQNTTCTSE